jgi:hypothetical protein
VKAVEASLIFQTFMLSMTLNFGYAESRNFVSSSMLSFLTPLG